ncbi:MAG: hypothetical protein GTO24_26915 [candidate division Zixibacteria bacterium]|nr:hypothetical protein [candidate division Zixibacteria bacterium]
MQILCPTCNTSYDIPDGKIPLKRNRVTCKKCAGQIVVGPEFESQAGFLRNHREISDQSAHLPSSTMNRESGELALLAEYPELQGLNSQKFDFKAIFSPNKKGRFKGRKNNLKLKILKAVYEVLEQRILGNGEKVSQVGKGTAFYPAEAFFGNGFLTMAYNHYALVCTNKRLLLINVNSRITHPTHYFFQIPYENIESVKRGRFSGSLVVNPARGRRRTFVFMKGYFSNDLKQFIQEKRNALGPPGKSSELLDNLCPSCFVPLKKGLVTCPQCRARFKESKKAFLRSLLLPGLGDIYLGHRALGILEMIGSVMVWAVALSLLLSGDEIGLTLPVFLVLFYNGVDGALTYHMAKKGYMLEKSI